MSEVLLTPSIGKTNFFTGVEEFFPMKGGKKKSASFLRYFAQAIGTQGLKQTQEVLTELVLFNQELEREKLDDKAIKQISEAGIVDSLKRLEEVLGWLINMFESEIIMDELLVKSIYDNLKKISTENRKALTTLDCYIDVYEANEAIKKGETYSADELLNELYG